MNLLNHYLDLGVANGNITIPDYKDAKTTNSLESIVASSNACASLNANRNANFLLLDWVDLGDAFNAVTSNNSSVSNNNNTGPANTNSPVASNDGQRYLGNPAAVAAACCVMFSSLLSGLFAW